MIFYALLLLLSMALVFFSQFLEKRIGIYVCVSVIILLGAFASLRGYVGTDTYSYHLQFERIESQDTFDATALLIEPAFYAIAKFLQFSGGNSYAYVLFIGILQTFVVIFILRRIEKPTLFLLFYIATFYLEFHFNILRASTSTLVILVSLLWIKEGGPKFYITLCSSILFHYAAIFVVVYVIIYRQLLNKKYFSAMLLTILLLTAISGLLIAFYDLIYTKYRFYIETDMMEERKFGIGLVLKLCLYIGLAITLIRRNSLEIIIFLFPLVLIRLSMLAYPILGRVESFVLPLFILILTNNDRITYKKDLIIIALCMVNVYGVISTISRNDALPLDSVHSASPFIPYHTLFEIK